MIFGGSRDKLLTAAQLKRLSEHKYNCESRSLLDRCLQPWWELVLSRTPLWVAPNLITVIGLIINIVTSLLLVYYSPDAKSEVPRWALALCALGLFTYQTLDAIDGKQARRTGSSSPLGELFDHGCDSVSTVFVAVSACISVGLGDYPSWMFFQCFCAITLFYCAHWQAYVSGLLRFGRVDVTEAQLTIIAMHLISAMFGTSIWSTKMFSSDFIELRHSILLVTLIGGSVAVYELFLLLCKGGVGKNGSTVAVPYFDAIFSQCVAAMFGAAFFRIFIDFFPILWTGGAGKNGSTVAIPWLSLSLKQVQVLCGAAIGFVLCERTISVVLAGGIGKNGSSVAGTSVLSPIIPLSLVVVPAFIIYRKSVNHLYENNPVLYILAFGLVGAKVTNRLVVAHMSKNEMDYLDTALIGPAMLFLNQYFNFFIDEYIVLWLCLIWVCFDLIRYSKQVCLEICEHMRIQLFRITPGQASAAQSSNKNVTGSTEALPQVSLNLTDDSSAPLLDSDVEDDVDVIYDASSSK